MGLGSENSVSGFRIFCILVRIHSTAAHYGSFIWISEFQFYFSNISSLLNLFHSLGITINCTLIPRIFLASGIDALGYAENGVKDNLPFFGIFV